MIEKAYKKLRLDALVIQQGRLVENTKSVNKEDLLNMVRAAEAEERASKVGERQWSRLQAVTNAALHGEEATAQPGAAIKDFGSGSGGAAAVMGAPATRQPRSITLQRTLQLLQQPPAAATAAATCLPACLPATPRQPGSTAPSPRVPTPAGAVRRRARVLL